jgi:cyclopropane-fatty-acyl-phospholipid synthase
VRLPRRRAASYDHIVSIEMFEAVGERFWPTYFAAALGLLKPGGRAWCRRSRSPTTLFARYRRGTDFIQQYVFPGGMLPSPGAVAQAGAARRAGGGRRLRLRPRLCAHPGRTGAPPSTRSLAAVRAQGFDERFRRLWRFYLAYCEAGFAQRLHRCRISSN